MSDRTSGPGTNLPEAEGSHETPMSVGIIIAGLISVGLGAVSGLTLLTILGGGTLVVGLLMLAMWAIRRGEV